MSFENSPIDLNFCPKLAFPTAQEIEEVIAQIPDEETRGSVAFAIENESVGDLPNSGLSEAARSKLEIFIDGMEIADIWLDKSNAIVGIHIQILAFARKDGAIEYRRIDEYHETVVLATLTEPPTLGEMIQIVIEAIEGTSDISWEQQFCCSYGGEIDYGAEWSVSSTPYPALTRWFEEETKEYLEYLEELESNDEVEGGA